LDLQWLIKAAKNGDALSQLILGEKYLYGRDVVQNIPEAIMWLQLAAENPNRTKEDYPGWAEAKLGEIYENGVGVPKNLKAAESWYLRAEALGWDTKKGFSSLSL